VTSVEEALSPVSEMLAADGYRLTVSSDDRAVAHVTISAGPEACEECLAPKAVVEAIILKNLEENGLSTTVELEYPNEAVS